MSSNNHDEIAKRYTALYTGAVSDVLDELGYRNQALPSTIVALRPGMRLAGPVFAINGRANPDVAYDASIRGVLRMLGEVPEGHVAVYAAGDDVAAHLGELSVAALKARGCVGALLDGGVRDVDLILDQKLPVFCRYATPQDGPGRWEVTEWGGTVRIGEVDVSTGDYLFADSDGALIIPAELTSKVLEQAEQIVGVENRVRAAVIDGTAPLTAYEQFGRF
ncbi:MAG TPA: RraA family protein [Jatrophihabitans sp.]|nr:RraA family protein [Jatrophihabitans sp.]